MRNDVMYTGVDNIMEGFSLHENPIFSVWKGKDLLFSHNEADFSKAEDLLKKNLSAWEKAGNNDALKIVFHPEADPKYITNKTPISGTIYVRCCEVGQAGNFYLPITGGNQQFVTGTREEIMMQKINELESRLKAFEEDPEEIEEESGIGKVMGTVNSLMSNPQIAEIITGILGQFIPGQNKNPLRSVAGIPESPEFTNALNYLSQVDPDFENDIILLANMARTNKQQFLFLVGMLRKQ